MISNDITKRKLPPLNSDKIETKSPKKVTTMNCIRHLNSQFELFKFEFYFKFELKIFD